jgi:tetratricopeptide (TPR) repeat protein
MTHFGPPYALPRNPEEFRRLCLKLLRRHWQAPGLERFQEAGDRELGIDLLEISGRQRLLAARCDLRERREPPGLAELRRLADRAASFDLPLGHFVIASTAWRSKALQRAVLELNRENRSADLFTIEVLCWDDIEELLDEYPDVLTEFEASPKRQALTKGSSGFRLQPRWPALPPAPADDEAGRELDDAAALIDQHHYQLGRLKLMQLRTQRWEQLSIDQRIALLGNLARAWLLEGEVRKASMLFIAARSIRPDDEDACTNEVLAHEMLEERERACALAEAVCAKFPRSGRAHALLLSNLPAGTPLTELERRTPPLVKMDPEVAIVMARRCITDSDYSRAERFARRATEAMTEKSDPWLLLGQAILLREIESNAGAIREDRVHEAEACLSRAVALAQEESAIGNEVQALLARAQARIALHEIEGTGRDIENAHALERDDVNGLCEYAMLLRSRGNLSGAVEIFRRAVKIGGRDDAEFHLAVTLRERDLRGDLPEAAEILLRTAHNPVTIPSGDYLFAVGGTVDVLSRLDRWHEAEALLAELPADRIPGAARFTLLARIELSRGETAKASHLADRALGELQAETNADERRNLAALLHDLGRYSEALVIWESIIQIRGFAAAGETGQLGATESDVRRLLECATRLGRHEVVLEVCRKLRVDGALIEGAFEFELEILERHDLPSAVHLIDQYLAVHPEDRVMRLRRSAASRALGHSEQATTEPDAMPPAREVIPPLGRVAVNLMREAGHPNEALIYAYELLRRHPGDPDAHRAFLSALGPLGPMPTVPDFDTAQPGCAVCFTEQDSNLESWAILEEAPDADESVGEYGPSSALMKQLRGRRLGDKFQLIEGRANRKTAVVKQLLSKYAYRYQDCLYGWSRRFPGLPEIEMIQADAKAAAEVPYNLVAVSKGMSTEEIRDNAHKLYALTPIAIHGYAERVGLNDLHGALSLAARPDAIIKCCQGSEEELEAALSAHNRANTIVLDLNAVATLSLLDRLDLLESWPRRFIVSQATLQELRRFQFEPNFALSGTSNWTGSEIGTIDVHLADVADRVASICTIADAGVVVTLSRSQREELIGHFGLHGAESIMLAAMPGHVLWTDDRVLANVARNDFGVRRIWTQSAFMALVQTGCLEAAELATATTKLAGWGYTFTTPSLETLMRAGAVAEWECDLFPLKQALDQFSTDSIRMPDAVILAGELIVHIVADQNLRSIRTSVIGRLLDRLAMRRGGREAIEALPRSLPIRFGLDLIGARELDDTIRGWMADNIDEAREETSMAGGGLEAPTTIS